MIENIEKKDAYKEVLMVLSYCDKDVIKKIPTTIFRKLANLAADSDIEVNIDIQKPIEEQNISDGSKSIISLLYYKYIADNDERNELITIWKNNDSMS